MSSPLPFYRPVGDNPAPQAVAPLAAIENPGVEELQSAGGPQLEHMEEGNNNREDCEGTEDSVLQQVHAVLHRLSGEGTVNTSDAENMEEDELSQGEKSDDEQSETEMGNYHGDDESDGDDDAIGELHAAYLPIWPGDHEWYEDGVIIDWLEETMELEVEDDILEEGDHQIVVLLGCANNREELDGDAIPICPNGRRQGDDPWDDEDASLSSSTMASLSDEGNYEQV